MPAKKLILSNNEIYHVIIRGVGDSLIFKDESDYFRAIFSLYEFNTTKPIEIRQQREQRKIIKAYGGPSSVNRDEFLLVEVLAFCFMPNHIHLLLKQIKNDGISKFMRKLGTGYAGYFNRKNKRNGYLFQGRFQALHIKDDTQLKVIFTYIHTNPLSLINDKWKTGEIINIGKSIDFLEKYKWSSYLDYIGKKNFPSVTKRDFLLELIDGIEMCKEMISNWIRAKKTKGFIDTELE
ncbi:MAG: transposase [Candidatus Paceibacterota bacterium]|jgi:putative transposase